MLASVLAERQHEVVWWTNAFDHQRKVMVATDGEELTLGPGIRARALRGVGYKRNVSLRRYVDHRIVARRFARRAQSVARPDVIVVSTPCHHAGFEAARYAVANGVPFILDVRDLWPDIFVDRVAGPIGRRAVRWLLRSDFARLEYQARAATAIVAMSNGILDWGLSRAGRSRGEADRVYYLGHPGHVASAAGLPDRCRDWFAKHSNRTVFTFVGTFGESYELDLILSAAERFDAAGRDDIGFVVVGDGAQRPAVERASEHRHNLLYCGWLDAAQVSDVLLRSHVGLVPCRSVENAAPNKLFEYTAAGLPVVSSLEGEMAVEIARHGMGINYSPGDAMAFEQAIARLAGDPGLRGRMALSAQAFHAGFGDARRIYADYADLVETVAAANAARAS